MFVRSPLLPYSVPMRLCFLLAVISIVAFGRCADAGVIVDDAAVQGHSVDIVDTLAVFMSAAEDSAPEPIHVERGDAEGPVGLAATPNHTIAPQATLLTRIKPQGDKKLQWRVEIANSILPNFPVSDGLLEPS